MNWENIPSFKKCYCFGPNGPEVMKTGCPANAANSPLPENPWKGLIKTRRKPSSCCPQPQHQGGRRRARQRWKWASWRLLKVLLPSCLIINSALNPKDPGSAPAPQSRTETKRPQNWRGQGKRESNVSRNITAWGQQAGGGVGRWKEPGWSLNKTDAHKSKVIRGHGPPAWSGTAAESHLLRKQAQCPQPVETKRVMGSVSSKERPAWLCLHGGKV